MLLGFNLFIYIFIWLVVAWLIVEDSEFLIDFDIQMKKEIINVFFNNLGEIVLLDIGDGKLLFFLVSSD